MLRSSPGSSTGPGRASRKGHGPETIRPQEQTSDPPSRRLLRLLRHDGLPASQEALTRLPEGTATWLFPHFEVPAHAQDRRGKRVFLLDHDIGLGADAEVRQGKVSRELIGRRIQRRRPGPEWRFIAVDLDSW